MNKARMLPQSVHLAFAAALLFGCSGSSSDSPADKDGGPVDAAEDPVIDAVGDPVVDTGVSVTDAAACGQPVMRCEATTCDTTTSVCCSGGPGGSGCVPKTDCPGFGSDAGPGGGARFECSSAANCPTGMLCCDAPYPGSICATECPTIGGADEASAPLCVCDSDCKGGTCVAVVGSSTYAWGHCAP
jgi:hypothetical protein